MITGVVSLSGEAVIDLEVSNESGDRESVEVVVDTDFTGFLTLRKATVVALSLPLLGSAPATLADGSTVALEVHEAVVAWHGSPRLVECLMAEGAPLVGMALLRGSRLTVDVVPGGEVRIEQPIG